MSVVFFTDRDLGGKIFPGRLSAAGLTVERHDDHFPPDAPDEAWLPEVAARGWVVLTQDQKIMRRPVERDALMSAGAAAFILIGGDAPASDLALNFVQTVHKILGVLVDQPRPFIAKVYRPSPKEHLRRGYPGRVDVVLTEGTWRLGG